MTTTDTIADVITNQRITVCASGYPDTAPILPGRAVVTIKPESAEAI